MRLLLAGLLLLSLPAAAQSVNFIVHCSTCDAGPEDRSQWQQVEASWVGHNTLQVSAWDTETQTRAVMDDSGAASVRPGSLDLSYQIAFTPLPAGAPVVFCEEFVRVIFTLEDLPRTDYHITLNNGEHIRGLSAEA